MEFVSDDELLSRFEKLIGAARAEWQPKVFELERAVGALKDRVTRPPGYPGVEIVNGESLSDQLARAPEWKHWIAQPNRNHVTLELKLPTERKAIVSGVSPTV